MSTDLTALAVAIVGVAGTMGAPWLTQQARRAEARDQADREERAREASRRDQLFEEKRALCAALNTATRAYRSALRDCALAMQLDEASEQSFAALEQARAAFKEQFSQAEMVLPQRPFEVAVAANEHLGYGYKLVLGLSTSADRVHEAEQAAAVIRGPLVMAVELLRQALREDLGVVGPIDDLQARLDALPIRSRSLWAGKLVKPPVEGPTATETATEGPE